MIPIPTLQQLYNGILADLQAEFSITIPLFGKNFLRALAAVQAAKLKLYYLAIGKLQKNIFVDTADTEASGGTLERFGRVKLNRDPFPARAAQYVLQVTGSIGAVIPASITFKSNDDSASPGILYILDTPYTLVATTDFITVRCLSAGLAGKLIPGNSLTITAPVANLNSLATVASEFIQPLAAEGIEDYRQKVLDSYRLEAQGGAATDYRLWAQDAQGVIRVYPYAKSGFPNEINLYVEATAVDSTDGKGTPSAQLLLDVEAVIEFDPDTSLPIDDRGRRPLGVFQVHYLPVTIKTLDIVIDGLIGRTAAIELQIQNAIKSELSKVRPFISAADIVANKNDVIDINKIIATIISAKPGVIFTSVSLTVDSIPTTSIQFINGDIPYVNSVTYTP